MFALCISRSSDTNILVRISIYLFGKLLLSYFLKSSKAELTCIVKKRKVWFYQK